MAHHFVEDDPDEPVEEAFKVHKKGVVYEGILRLAENREIPLEGALWSAFYAGFYAGKIVALAHRIRAVEAQEAISLASEVEELVSIDA